MQGGIIISQQDISHRGTWLNKYDTDSPLCVLRIASARMGDISISCNKNIKNYIEKKNKIRFHNIILTIFLKKRKKNDLSKL